MPARYIDGFYYRNNSDKKIITDEVQAVLEVLRDSHPAELTINQILKEKKGLNDNTVRQAANKLAAEDFILKKRKSPTRKKKTREREPLYTYAFEDRNFKINREADYKFAPGYVAYDSDFENYFDALLKSRFDEIEGIYRSLVQFIRSIFNEMESKEARNLIAPKLKDNLCNNCGYNHEVRDFIRACLLRLIDEFEANKDFIDFLKKGGFLSERAAEEQIKQLPKEIATTPNISFEEVTSQREKSQPIYNGASWSKTGFRRFRRPSKNKSSVRKNPINESAFDIIDDRSAYWIGCIVARGSISYKGRNKSPTIGFESMHEEIVEEYKKFLNLHHKIYHDNKKGVFSIQFNSPYIGDKLRQYGLVPRKRFSEALNPSLIYNRDCWRGVVDVHGTLDTKYGLHQFRLKSSENLVKQFKTFIVKSVGEVDHDMRPLIKNYFITIKNNDDIIKVVKLLYDHCSFALSSNLEKVQQILQS